MTEPLFSLARVRVGELAGGGVRGGNLVFPYNAQTVEMGAPLGLLSSTAG
jgi:hypothetical protein